MNTLSGRYVPATGRISGIEWATTRASRVELSVTCDRGSTRFTVERDAGHGFQDPTLHEEFYPHRGSRSLTLLDYTAPMGRDVIYRVTFFGDSDEAGVPVTISVPTHWRDEGW